MFQKLISALKRVKYRFSNRRGMATIPSNAVTIQQQQSAQTETVEINDFMLKLVQVINKRFGMVNSQINSALANVAKKDEVETLKTQHKKEMEELQSRLVLLESDLLAFKNSSKPVEPKVNRNILKHLE